MNNNYIVEFSQFGKLIKVSAFDPATLKEISIVVPAGKKLSQKDMIRLAVQRLEYVLKKSGQN